MRAVPRTGSQRDMAEGGKVWRRLIGDNHTFPVIKKSAAPRDLRCRSRRLRSDFLSRSILSELLSYLGQLGKSQREFRIAFLEQRGGMP